MRSILTIALILCGGLLPAAQVARNSPNEQARRLLEDGREYWREQKFKQALDNFNTIINGFSESDSIDDAMLELGRYKAEIEKDYDGARESFQQVAQRFPQSDGAPGAYYYLGWLTMLEASTTEEVDDALAQFQRVQRLYPRSDWVPRAMHAAGLAERKVGRLDEAVELQRRVSMEYPSSEAAPAAQFEVGHLLGLQGDPMRAMEEYQAVRNRFPDSPWAERAIERITGLYRFRDGKPRFSRDPSYRLAAGDLLRDVRAILYDDQGRLWLASDKTDSVVPFGTGGRMGSSFSAKDLRGLSLTPEGEIVVAAKTALRFGARHIQSFSIPPREAGKDPEEIEDITAALVLPGGDVLVADDDRKAVERFDPTYEYIGPFPDTREREVTRLTRDLEGGIVMLDERAKAIQVYSATGEALRSIPFRGAGYEIEKPRDVAVDPALRTYVVDEKSATVSVFAPDGTLIGGFGRGDLRKPVALTLEPSGAVLVYDEAERQVVRFN